MKINVLIVILLSLCLAACAKSKGPAKIVTPPPTGGTGPVVPGIGQNGVIRVEVEEGGSVSTSPAIGGCGGPGTCQLSAPRGTSVTLFANPASGWMFEEWDNCPSAAGSQCIVTVDALTYVKAEFDR